MDLFKILRFYVDKMLKEVPGMKVLVLDEETTQSVSMVYSQSEILEQEVFLVEKMESQSNEKLHHLKVCC
jgi:vacuolar protein sorting-associated protein 45